MAYDRFLIAPINSGLQKDLQPWLIPDDAYAELNNAYIFRGRVRKRFGSSYMGATQLNSRLRIALGTTDGVGGKSGTVPGNIFGIGQMFSIGTQLYTVDATGTPANMITTGAGTGTYNTTTGAYVFTGAPLNTQVYFYPAQPVMGITQYEVGAINNHPSYAFDTQFAYLYAGGAWGRAGTAVWTGDDADFFWSTTWDGITANQTILFTTNFKDPIRSWDGATWTDFTPQYLTTAGNIVLTARIVLPFKNRLILLNTVEQVTGPTTRSYVNRCRFSQNGSPLQGVAPFYTNSWLEQTQTGSQGAGFIDATTEEAIISAEFIKDRLIVYFERSTWELAYTGNEVLPFVWQKINTELGSESEFSTVPFDKVVLTVGNSGIHACSGANVERTDNKIPDDIFQIRNSNDGAARVAGIRDYYTELVYWSLPSIAKNINGTYPDRVLIYNYRNGSWAYNDDCITTFGYFEQQPDTIWQDAEFTWQSSQATWTSGVLQSEFRQIIAGNQQGYIFIIDPDSSQNAAAMYITAITQVGTFITLTIMNHTLTQGEYIYITNAVGSTNVNDTIFIVDQIIDAHTIRINNVTLNSAYLGGGCVTRVSNIQILSKQWNFYNTTGQNVYLAKIDFNVTRTSQGELTVDYYPSSSSLSMINGGQATGALLGTNVLETKPYDLVPLEKEQDRLWHPVYFQTSGETVQIFLSFTDEQIRTPTIAFSGFELNGLVVYAMPSGRLQ